MQIITLPLGPLETNCYLVADECGNATVIDPAGNAPAILQAAQKSGLTIQAVLLTHGHFDHVGAVSALREALHCPVWLHENERVLPPQLTNGALTYTDTYGEGDALDIGALRFVVLHTSGHTPGSVCLRCGNTLFTGDTLFAGACGRTDFAGGSDAQMRQSLARLAALEENLTVLPGHGEASTLDRERKTNPYLRRAMR